MMENLDLRCAELGQRIARTQGVDEKHITDAISVLEEQGLYAAFLFLQSRKGGASRVCTVAVEFLEETPKGEPLLTGAGDDPLRAIRRQVCTDLDKMLLARDLVRQAFVYARYHLKAR